MNLNPITIHAKGRKAVVEIHLFAPPTG